MQGFSATHSLVTPIEEHIGFSGCQRLADMEWRSIVPKKANYSRPIKEMGFLQPNKRQINASSPDYTGEIVVDDVPYRISLWNEAKDRKAVALYPMAQES